MQPLTNDDVIVERIIASGAYSVAAIVTDQTGEAWRERHVYMGYTADEARAAFLAKCEEAGLAAYEEGDA